MSSTKLAQQGAKKRGQPLLRPNSDQLADEQVRRIIHGDVVVAGRALAVSGRDIERDTPDGGTLEVDGSTCLRGSGTVPILIGTEIVIGSVDNSGVMTVLARGALGTAAASHADGAIATAMQSKVFRIAAIDALTKRVTLNGTLSRGFGPVGAPEPGYVSSIYWAGALAPKLTGDFTIDGEYDGYEISDVWQGLTSVLSTNFIVQGTGKIFNMTHGGMLLWGCDGANVSLDAIDNVLYEYSEEELVGTAVWFFGGCQRCKVAVRALNDMDMAYVFDQKSYQHPYYAILANPTGNILDIGTITNTTYEGNFAAATNNVVTIRYSNTTGDTNIFDDGGVQVTDSTPSVGNIVSVAVRINGLPDRGNCAHLNTVIANGIRNRQVVGTVAISSGDVELNPQTTTVINKSLAGLLIGDKIELSTEDPWPNGVSAYGKCVMEGVATMYFVNSSASDAFLEDGQVISVTASGQLRNDEP